jgi:hypothetical protein
MPLKIKNHQPLLRVVAWMLQNFSVIRQACLPAYGLVLIIRMEGIGAPLHGTGERLELALKLSMTLIEVNQRGRGRVK